MQIGVIVIAMGRVKLLIAKIARRQQRRNICNNLLIDFSHPLIDFRVMQFTISQPFGPLFQYS